MCSVKTNFVRLFFPGYSSACSIVVANVNRLETICLHELCPFNTFYSGSTLEKLS